jgi:hypothetical protein
LQCTQTSVAARIPGLPDGIFSNQKSKFGYIPECLAKQDVGKFYDNLVYFTAIWNIFWTFGLGLLWPFWYIFPVWDVVPRIFGNLVEDVVKNFLSCLEQNSQIVK